MNDTRRPEQYELAGMPSGKLVREVRSVLWSYLRARPRRSDRAWREAWAWAEACARRDAMLTRRTHKWPMPTEIASQYLFLVLMEMRDCRALRLPFHAAEQMPECIAQRFNTAGALPFHVPAIAQSGSAPTNSGGTS